MLVYVLVIVVVVVIVIAAVHVLVDLLVHGLPPTPPVRRWGGRISRIGLSHTPLMRRWGIGSALLTINE